jgi:hypothetical protein
MNFGARPASPNWEPLSLPTGPQHAAWVWYKPAAAPTSVVVQIPPQIFAETAGAPGLTLRTVARALGLEAHEVLCWSVYGVPGDGLSGANPAWDFPLAAPEAAAPDQTIAFFINPARAAPAPMYAPPVVPVAAPLGAADPALAALFGKMDADWHGCLQIEVQIVAAAKQLETAMLRVNALNRDLSPDESRCADQIDKRDWQDARRWLREAATRITRVLKDHQMGMTSVAGKRTTFETIYSQYVQPRRLFEGIEQTERDFEAYRKMLQTLLSSMSTVLSSAVQEGERRAQTVMSRVAAKLRTARTKR